MAKLGSAVASVVWIVPALALAQAAETRASDDFETFETGDGWGIVEHELRVVPSGEEQPPAVLSGDLPERPGPEWPGDHLREGWDYGTSFSYPQLYPNVAARLVSWVGDADDQTNVVSRVEAEFYLLHVGITFLESVGGDRRDSMQGDVDLRIPIALGDGHRLAILPGVSFPIGGENIEEDTTAVRLQSVYGFGRNGLGLQLRAGVVEGARPAGLLAVADTVDSTAALYGAMVAWRIVDVLQLRMEASGEIAATDGEPDRLDLLPGVVFFPWGDPRLHIGLTGVVEFASEGLEDDPNFGGLLDVGIFFY